VAGRVVRAVARGKDSGGGDDETAPAWAGGEPAGGGARVRPRGGRREPVGSGRRRVQSRRFELRGSGAFLWAWSSSKSQSLLGWKVVGEPIKVWGGLLLVRPICSGIAQLLWCDSKKKCYCGGYLLPPLSKKSYCSHKKVTVANTS
jgi:hypothetical protein